MLWHAYCKGIVQNLIVRSSGDEEMTEREAIDIIRDSTLWDELSKTEKAEAITYAIEIAKRTIHQEIRTLKSQSAET
jgi:hypothetical protein